MVLIVSVVWGWGMTVGFGFQGPTGSTPVAVEGHFVGFFRESGG